MNRAQRSDAATSVLSPTQTMTDYFASLHAFRRSVLDAARNVKLDQLRPGITYEQIIPSATYAPWRDNTQFADLHKQIAAHTLVDIYRCFELWHLCGQVKAIEGDVLEVGVWRGGTGALLGAATRAFGSDCTVWLADTFAGVPKTDPAYDTKYEGGEHADTSEAIVRDLVSSLSLTNVKILTGLFPETTGGVIADRRIRLCHIDVDSYASARDVFNWVWPRLTSGGVVVFDDFGFWGCEGVVTAVHEISAEGAVVIHNLNGHALVVKAAR
jgi:O-methyltransferase